LTGEQTKISPRHEVVCQHIGGDCHTGTGIRFLFFGVPPTLFLFEIVSGKKFSTVPVIITGRFVKAFCSPHMVQWINAQDYGIFHFISIFVSS
jgi:hypothetical protein